MTEKAQAVLVRLTAEQKRRIDALAKKEERSRAYMIRRAVDLYLKSQEGQ